jgi:hypothetical protein
MKKEIKNIHSEMIRLFVKREDVEKQVDIPPGESIIVDDYETKTIIIFKRKGLITFEDAQTFSSDSFHFLDENNNAIDTIGEHKTMDETIDPNNDEVMDHFHTTEDHEAILLDDDMKYFKENLMRSLTKAEEPTKLEVVEGEVEQYVEDGFVKGEWTDEDTAFLKKNYPTKGRSYCSTHLNRNETSVQKKINALGLKKKKKKK